MGSLMISLIERPLNGVTMNNQPGCSLVEVNISEDDILSDETNDDSGKAFFLFCDKVRRDVDLVTPAGRERYVYVSMFFDQAFWDLPQVFFDLIHETKWPVSFDLND